MVQEPIPPAEPIARDLLVRAWWRWGVLEPIGIVLLALASEPRRQRPHGALGSRRAALRRLRSRDAARGDWIFPTFNGEPRYHKPILIYWLMGLGTALGRRQSVWRAAGLGGRRRGDGAGRLVAGPADVRAARRAAGRADLGDGADRGRRVEAGDDRRDAGALAPRLPGVPLGAGPAAVARRGRALLGLPEPGDLDQGPDRTGLDRGLVARGLVVGLAGSPPGNGCTGGGDSSRFAILTAPWFVAISMASRGEFLRFAVGRQIVHRLASDMEAHGGFPGYYPVISALVFYPWSALVPAALVGAWMRRKSDPTLGFLLGWAIGPLLLARMLPHQADPLLPARVSRVRPACRHGWSCRSPPRG